MADRTVKVSLLLQAAGYLQGMEAARKATAATGTEAEKLAQKRESFQQLGTASLAMGAAMGAGVALAVSKFAEFDQAMSNVAATGDDARQSMDALRDAAIEAGARTVFSATESANAIEEMAKAGVDAADILSGGLNGALDLAAAGGLGVADAAGIAATALKVFGLRGTDMSHVADLLAAGAGKAMGDVQDLSQALAQGGQVAAATGLSIEETTAALASFASQGLLGSDAGTSLKTMLQRLTPQSDAARETFAELGISAYDAQGQFVGLADFAGQLQTQMRNLTPEARNAALSVMFGSDAVRAANVLYKEGAAGIENWISAVDDQGYAAETARTRLDNLKGDWEALTGAIDSAMITMGEAANGPLRALVQGLTGLVDDFNGLPDWAQQTALGVGALAAAAGLASGAFFLAVPKMAEFNAALADMGPRAQRVGRAVGNITAAATGVAAGVTIGVTAANLLTDAFQNAGLAGEELANRIRTAASATQLLDAAQQKGLLGGSNTKFATSQIEVLGDALDAVRTGYRDTLQASGKGLVAANAISNVKELGEDLGTLAQTDLPAAQQQFRLLAESADLSREQQATLIDQMGPFKDQLIAQATAAGQAADGQALVTLAMGAGEKATADNTATLRELAGQAQATGDEVEGLADQIRDFGSASLDQRAAQRAFEQSFDDLSQSIKDNGATLDVSTEKGRANGAAIDDLAKSTLEYSAAVAQRTGDEEKAASVIADGRQRVIDMLEAFQITGDEAEAYADKLGLIPENIDTAVYVETEGAQGSINRLIDENQNRRITLNVVTNESRVQFSNGLTATSNFTGNLYEGGKAKAFAAGGFASGIYAGQPGGIHKFAEGHLPWEAYISPDPAYRARNLAIHEETGRRLGAYQSSPAPVIINTSSGDSGPRVNAPITVNPAPGMSEQSVAQAAVRELQFQMRSSQ